MLNRVSISCMSCGVARPILMRPSITWQARFRSISQLVLRDIDHHGRHAAPCVSGRDAGSHQTAAEHSDTLHVAGLRGCGEESRIATERVVHEEHRNQIRRDRRAGHFERDFLFDLQSLVERPVDSQLDRLQRGERSRVLPLRFSFDRSFGAGEREHQLGLAESQRLRTALPIFVPRLCQPCRFASHG